MRASSNYALRLPASLKRAVEEVAREGGTTLNQFICERGCGKARSTQDRGLLCQTGRSRGFCRLRSLDAQAWRSSQGR